MCDLYSVVLPPVWLLMGVQTKSLSERGSVRRNVSRLALQPGYSEERREFQFCIRLTSYVRYLVV
jgi:hypothetical protein